MYWRVSGVDAEDQVGTASAGWNFIKNIPAPTLVSPGDGSAITEPILEWQAVQGAAYYRVELSTDPKFMNDYTSALFLPHTDIEKFPSVRRELNRRALA